MDDEAFRLRLREGVDLFSRRRPADEESWNRFSAYVSYLSDDFSDPDSGPVLSQRLEELERAWGVRANRVFYLAIPPDMMEAAGRTCSDSASAVTAGGTAWWWKNPSAGTWRPQWRWTVS